MQLEDGDLAPVLDLENDPNPSQVDHDKRLEDVELLTIFRSIHLRRYRRTNQHNLVQWPISRSSKFNSAQVKIL